MTGPDRIWATAYYNQNRSEHVREWSERGYDDRQAYEYIRRDPAVLAALPEVQAIVAAAIEAEREKLEGCLQRRVERANQERSAYFALMVAGAKNCVLNLWAIEEAAYQRGYDDGHDARIAIPTNHRDG